jgi:HAMP domain-containing protein
LYDIAIPLSYEGRALGILDLQVSRETAVTVINNAMTKYAVGAVGVLLLLGVPLYFFLHRWVLIPLFNLREAVESVSFKTFELKFPARADEIGDVAEALKLFLFKVKGEMSTVKVRESQRGVSEARWWRSILFAVVPKNYHAIVVDEDNSVLYTNFQMPVVSGIPGIEDKGNKSVAKPHLLDVIDTQQQEVLRLIGIALDRPNQVVEADTIFKSEPCHVKAIHLEEEGELRRTLVLFEPKNPRLAASPSR